VTLEARAIARIQQAYLIATNAGNTLVCAYSGGKDSDVLLDLCIKADVPFQAEHNHTTVDAPETVYHIREVFSQLAAKGISSKINMPDITMMELIVKKKIPPLRTRRYCCQYLKERNFANQHLLLGVRWAESTKRRTRGVMEKIGATIRDKIVYQDENDDVRKLNEICLPNNRVVTNPIIDWTDAELWQYIHENKLKMNPLYECGFKRVGCIGCPMAGKFRLVEFARYPKYKAAYIRAFDKMVIARNKSRKLRGLPPDTSPVWNDGKLLFKWWTDPSFNERQLSLEWSEDD
jgi:phosphoadenosine phosphosulfate reductase